MKLSRLTLLLFCFLAAAPTFSRAADRLPATSAGLTPAPQARSVPAALGLQVALTTGQYRFVIPGTPAVSAPRESFPASALLANFSREDVTFIFPDTGSASLQFAFRVYDSSGALVWETDAPPGHRLSTTVVLPRKSVWKRTVQVPLKKNGAWLPAGRYRLTASLPGEAAVSASSLFEIVAAGVSANTGIEGQVLQLPVVSWPSGRTTANLPYGVKATVSIHEYQDPGKTYPHPPFSWSGPTDDQGRFRVATPPGRFSISAKTFTPARVPVTGLDSVEPSYAVVSQDVHVEAGRYTRRDIHVSGGVLYETPPANTGIHGLVLQKAGADGAPPVPLAGARVLITPGFPPNHGGVYLIPTGYPAWSGFTDADGRFATNLHPATYRVDVYQPVSVGGSNSTQVLVAAGYATIKMGEYTELTLTAVSNPPPSAKARLVYSVHSVNAVFESGGTLRVTASGSVSSAGWTNPQLIRRPTSDARVLVLDFVADPPEGVAAQVISPVSATVEVPGAAGVLTVHVKSQTNSEIRVIARTTH